MSSGISKVRSAGKVHIRLRTHQLELLNRSDTISNFNRRCADLFQWIGARIEPQIGKRHPCLNEVDIGSGSFSFKF